MNLENATVKKDTFKNIIKNREYNKIIIDYHKEYEKEIRLEIDNLKGKKNQKSKNKYLKNLKRPAKKIYKDNTYLNKIKNLENCNKLWNLDKYKKAKVKDFKSTNLCKNKFCANCKKVKQAARMSKYIPEIEKYPNRYFLTLTQTDITDNIGETLRTEIKRMNKAFKKLIIYLSGRLKIKDIDFSDYSYLGAVRSLEITFVLNKYHAHIHAVIVSDNKNMLSDKKNINKYSYDYKTGKKVLKRKFSDEEILIQKIWYLLLNNKTVNKKNIENLKNGYSCTLDKLKDNDYIDMFKYMTKETDQEGNILTYENFKVLDYALYRIKQIQGYGCLYQINDTIDTETIQQEYEKEIEKLQKKEVPENVFNTPTELYKDNEYTTISRKEYMKYYNSVFNSKDIP